jgi:hypothetical protein
MNIEPIKLFIEKIEKLERHPFWLWIKTPNKLADHFEISQGTMIKFKSQREEDLESFCLTFRLVLQNRDGISIGCMRNFSDAHISHTHPFIHTEITKAAEELKTEINQKSLVQLQDRNTTYHEIFDIIFYGGLAHADKEKRLKFKHLIQSGSFSYFVMVDFYSAIIKYRNCYVSIGKQLTTYLHEIEHSS